MKPKTILLALALLATAGGVGWKYWPRPAEGLDQKYVTAAVERGPIVQVVAANGTLNPVVLVSVGTQVSGIVKKLHADFNDQVKAGQVLLELDPSLVAAQLAQSKANLASAEASLDLARANAARSDELFAKEYVSRQEHDQSRQALRVAEAAVQVARAQVSRDATNVSYAVIRSPVTGVVVSRSVDEGQTVAASFQTPTLFSIAQDLAKMRILANVAEADIGGVKPGQAVTFTVDAFPGRSFHAKVAQVRLNPTTQSNVVTYSVVIDAANDDKALIPGMTAYVAIVAAEKADVVKVPNAALRFRPTDKNAVVRDGKAADTAKASGRTATDGPGDGLRGTVYKLAPAGLQPVALRIGISDGSFTEAMGEALHPGDQLAIEEKGGNKQTQGGGPFGPPPR